MTKTAILDSKLITQEIEKTERTNLLLSNSKLIGIGYIPDDEDGNKVQANGYYTLNAITSIILNISNSDKQNAAQFGITNWISQSDRPSHDPNCIAETSPHINAFIDHAETTQTPCLIALQTCNSDLLKTDYTHTTFSIPSSEVVSNTKETLRLLLNKKATHIHLVPPFTDTSIYEIHEALKSTFSLRDISAFLSFNAWPYLDKKPDSISLLKSPSFTLFSPTKTPHILGAFQDGTAVVQS